MTEVIEKPQKTKKQKKQPWQIVLKDRFLTNEKPDNPYAVALLYFTVFFLSFLLVFVCFFQLCAIRGDSMLTTLHNGDHVLLLRESSSFDRGDIVVITKGQEDKKVNIVKRIIGVAGDTLRFDEDREHTEAGTRIVLFLKKRNSDTFVRQEESYIREPMQKGKGFPDSFQYGKEIEVPAGHVFVMGDNRNISEDSRATSGDGSLSFFPLEAIYGKSVLTIPKGSALEYLLKILYHENKTVD